MLAEEITLERIQQLSMRSAHAHCNGDMDYAEELAQEATISAWRAMRPGLGEAYYQRCISNRIIDVASRGSMLGLERTSYSRQVESVAVGYIPEVVEPPRGPELSNVMKRAMASLDEESREIALSVAHGEPRETVAKLLGKNIRQIGGKWIHVRKRLREEMR